MIKEVLHIVFIYGVPFAFVMGIFTLWEKGKKFVLKQLAIAIKKDFEIKNRIDFKKYNWLIRLNPIPSNYSLRAGAYSNVKQSDKAIKDISKAIDINPYYADFYKSRAYYYSTIGKNDLAIEDYNKAIDLQFNLKSYYQLFLFRAQSLKDNEKYQLAIIDYDIVIKNIPEEIEAYIGKGICLSRLNEDEKAIDIYKIGLEIEPNTTELYVNIGISLSNLNKTEESLVYFGKALEIDNKNDYAYYNRGLSFYYLKKVNEALQDLNKALELNPKTDRSYLFLYLGDLYAIVEKDNEKAMNFLQKAKELGNKNAQEHIDELNSKGTLVLEW